MKLFKPQEIALMLKVTPFTVRDWIRKGNLKAIRVGPKLWRVREEDLQEYLKQQEVCSDESAHQNAS